jgi:hypothetical protein
LAVRTAKNSFIQLSTKGTGEGTSTLKTFAFEFTAEHKQGDPFFFTTEVGRLECQGMSLAKFPVVMRFFLLSHCSKLLGMNTSN